MGQIQRLALTATTLTCLLSIVPASASGGQETRGYVVQPTWEEGCVGYVGAVLETALRAHLGFRFTVSKTTWDKPFLLAPDLPTSDIDISFLKKSGTSWHTFTTRKLGGEAGTVPDQATEARVCLYVGSPTTFTYRVGPAI